MSRNLFPAQAGVIPEKNNMHDFDSSFSRFETVTDADDAIQKITLEEVLADTKHIGRDDNSQQQMLKRAGP